LFDRPKPTVGCSANRRRRRRVEESWKPPGKLKSLKMRTAYFFEMSQICNPATWHNNPEDLN
jgi:hypothetical protein